MRKGSTLRGKEEVFAIYMLQFKMLRWIKKFDGKWTPKSRKIDALGDFGHFFWDFHGFWQDFFWCFFVWLKGGSKKHQIMFLGGFEVKNWDFGRHVLALPPILSDSGRLCFFYLTTPHTGWCRRILAPAGFWRGSQKWHNQHGIRKVGSKKGFWKNIVFRLILDANRRGPQMFEVGFRIVCVAI